MANAMNDFNARLTKINKTRTKTARGSKVVVDKNGLMTVRPKRSGVVIPFKQIFLLIALFWGFKALVYAHLGPQAYSERVSKLENGTQIEAVGAKLMVIDPATVWLSQKIGPMLR